MLEKHISEKRLVGRITKYWERLRGEDEMPHVNKLNNEAIIDIWDHCFTLEVTYKQGKPFFRYLYIGPEIKRAFGNKTGQEGTRVSLEIVPGGKIMHHLDKCIDKREAFEFSGNFVNDKSQAVKYRSCAVPFSLGREEITNLLVGLSWRAF